MNQCFVIQPFDNGGKYDKRYNDTFQTAITEAGYTPYRVDKDPAVEIPIEDIDSNIMSSTAVLADITEDNPNVWFEVGLAIAYKKKLILICSKERKTKYPFDIQHRSIISYDVDSPSDYEKLKQRIKDKLEEFAKQITSVISRSEDSLMLSENKLSQESMLLLGTIGNSAAGPFEKVRSYFLVQEFNKAGYTQLAFNFAAKDLLDLKYIDSVSYSNNGDEDIYYSITPEGFDWMKKNKSRFNIVSEQNDKAIEAASSEVNNENPGDKGFPEDVPF